MTVTPMTKMKTTNTMIRNGDGGGKDNEDNEDDYNEETITTSIKMGANDNIDKGDADDYKYDNYANNNSLGTSPIETKSVTLEPSDFQEFHAHPHLCVKQPPL